jgi:signal transduction histidine kinase/ActR/RegA family two-component response regulator
MISPARDLDPRAMADWRAVALRRLSRVLVAFAAPALVLIALSPGPFDLVDRALVLALSLAFVSISVLSHNPRLTRSLAIALVLTLLLVGLALVARVGATPGVLLGLGCSMVLAALFLGKKIVWSASILTTSVIVLIGVASAAGLLHQPDPSAAFDWTRLSTWVRYAAGYFAFTSIVASAVTTLIARLEGEIRGRETLLIAEREARTAAETAHAEAREAAGQAAVANQLKDEFLSIVSHELRTPLNAIMGWAQMLRSGALAAERRQHAFDVIVRNACHQEGLIADLLDVSRITAGRLSLGLQPVSPADVVRMAVESVQPAAEAKRLHIVTLREGPIPTIRGDAGRLQQVVTNLLTNAVKFSSTGGRVEVTIAHDPSNVSITVCDHGEGIAPSFLPHLFTPFRQANGGLSRRTGGLGLGLTIAKRLVELHGGSIEARSEGEGRGATFVVRLPTPPALTQASPAAPSSSPEVGGHIGGELQDATILIVEDEPDSRALLVELFESRGARVMGAATGAEAIDHLRGTRPDVILSDIGLAGEDGRSLLRKLREKHGARAIPAVALTAYVRSQDRAAVLAAGFDAHVAKPVDVGQLLPVVAKLLRGQRQE